MLKQNFLEKLNRQLLTILAYFIGLPISKRGKKIKNRKMFFYIFYKNIHIKKMFLSHLICNELKYIYFKITIKIFDFFYKNNHGPMGHGRPTNQRVNKRDLLIKKPKEKIIQENKK
jgi:hypothetical protein